MKLIDRKEDLTIKGDVYQLTLIWNNRSIRESAVGMPPQLSYIRKNGKNFATIFCSSNINGFTVEAFHKLMEKPAWQISFIDCNVSTIPFENLLSKLPLDKER